MDALGPLSSTFLDSHPEEAALILERHPATGVAGLLQVHPTSTIAAVLRAVLPVNGAAYLSHLDTNIATQVMQTLGAEHTVRLLRHQAPEQRAPLLAGLTAPVRDGYHRILSFTEDRVGAYMNPVVHVLPEDVTVADAMKRVRRYDTAAAFYPYIVDRDQKLLGILTVRDLMLATPRQRLSEIMQTEVVRLPARATSHDVRHISGRRAYQSIPVVDDRGRLIGIISQEGLARLEANNPLGPAAGDAVVDLGAPSFRLLAGLTLLMTQVISVILGSKPTGTSHHAD